MNTGSNYPIESDIIETHDGEFYDVIGFDHPTDRVIAYIKYFPILKELQNAESIRTIKNSHKTQQYGKLYDLKNREEWIFKNHPNYLIHPSNYDFPFQAVPREKLKTHFKPEIRIMELNNVLSEYQNQPEIFALYQDTLDFCNFLSKKSDVPIQNIGITGSLLSDMATPDSDLDLVVYGFLNSLRIRDTIRTIFQQNEPNAEIRRYNKEEMKILFKKRAQGTTLTFYEFLKYEFRKLHQGKFRNRDFFIRFLECNNRNEYEIRNRFEKQQIKVLGRITISGQVRGDEFWWTTPARLDISNITYLDTKLTPDAGDLLIRNHLSLNQMSKTFTLRGRIIENARLLEGIVAEGNLEMIIPKGEPAYLQLSLGSDPRDYLKQA